MTRLALVTGAGSGIGRAVTLSLAAAGHRIAATDIDPITAGETLERILDKQGSRAFGMDVTDSSQVREVVAHIREEMGPVEILVNCAGWDSLMPFMQTDEAFWDKILELNLKGVLRTTKAVLPGMIEAGWGRIVNISSDAGRVGSSLEAVYSAAKGGVIAFGKTVAREVARNGITVNAVCPGPTQTRLLAEIAAASNDSEKVIGAMERGVPMKRLGEPNDVAAAVRYLTSEEAAYVTGQTLSVSGGLTMA